jgi:hypothetical protein
MKFDKSFFIRCKVYIDRARMYMGYIQFVLLIFMFLETLKEKHFIVWFKNYPVITSIVGLGFFLLASLFIGWLDYKIGLFAEEQKRHSSLNPILTDILNRIKNIEKETENHKIN